MSGEIEELRQKLANLTRRLEVEIARSKIADLVMENTMKILTKQFIVLAASQIISYTSTFSKKNKPKIELDVRYKTLAEFESNVVKPAKMIILLNPEVRRQCSDDCQIIDAYNTRT